MGETGRKRATDQMNRKVVDSCHRNFFNRPVRGSHLRQSADRDVVDYCVAWDPQIIKDGTPMGPLALRNGTSLQSNLGPPPKKPAGTSFGLGRQDLRRACHSRFFCGWLAFLMIENIGSAKCRDWQPRAGRPEKWAKQVGKGPQIK